MKREIYCLDCELGLKKSDERKEINFDEYRSVHGFAIRNLLCDLCNAPIANGDPCACFTMRRYGEQFYDWEPEYIMPLEKMFSGVSSRDLKTAKSGKKWNGDKT
jgi:hypothetical protein